jgi:hypothetical protein
MSQVFKDEVFAPLAKRLEQINVEQVFGTSMRVAGNEGRELLREQLRAEGAPAHIATKSRFLGVQGLTAAVGIPDTDPASDDALEWEYGSMDGSTPPHQTFSFVADDMAAIASDEAAERLSKKIAGLS